MSWSVSCWGRFLEISEREKRPSQIRETFYVADPGLRRFGVLSGMCGDREEASHGARSLPLIPKANFILDRTDTFFANRDGKAAKDLNMFVCAS